MSMKKGLSLLEILISLVLISMVLVGLVHLFIAGKRYVLHSRARLVSSDLGRVFLDPRHMEVREDQWAPGVNCLSSLGAVGCPGFQVVGNITYNSNYTITNHPQEPNLRKVRLDITWTE